MAQFGSAPALGAEGHRFESCYPDVHISTRQVLRYFQYEHLQEGLGREIASYYADMAYSMANRLPEDPETTVALRKLLESKDAAVRAALRIEVDNGAHSSE